MFINRIAVFYPFNIAQKNMSYEFSDGFKIRDQSAKHFMTFSIMGWIDIFTRQVYRDIIIESFKFCRKEKGLKIGAYVIMSNHLHSILWAKNGNLSDIIRDFKRFTSRAISRTIETEKESRREWLLRMFNFFCPKIKDNDKFKIWTGDNHPEEIYGDNFQQCKLNYIHQNPVRAGLVRKPEDYIYSSASIYAGKKGIMDIDLL